MSKYPEPNDDTYKCILSNLKVFLNFTSTQQLWKAIVKCDDRIVCELLDSGADPDLKTLEGKSALHLAADVKSESITRVLLSGSRKINVNSTDACGKTALEYAISNCSKDIIRLLLGRGAISPEEGPLKCRRREGPALDQNMSSLYKSGSHLSAACRRACDLFCVTKTIFYLIREQNGSSEGNAGKISVESSSSDAEVKRDEDTQKSPREANENSSENKKDGDYNGSGSQDMNLGSNYVEWRLPQSSTVYDTLYSGLGSGQSPEPGMTPYNKSTMPDTWTWYHFPTNNASPLEQHD
jgi:hypothetical protein